MHLLLAADTTVRGAVARIALVKPDKAKGVENMVLQMAQRGQLNEKVILLERCTVLSLVKSSLTMPAVFLTLHAYYLSVSTCAKKKLYKQ